MTSASSVRAWWWTVLAASALLMITMGARQSLGLFVSPLNTDTGLGIVAISFALAVGQFVWGAAQPIAGAYADKYGPGRVLAAGVILAAVLAAWGPCGASCPADLDGNGEVGAPDLAAVLAAWGACP